VNARGTAETVIRVRLERLVGVWLSVLVVLAACTTNDTRQRSETAAATNNPETGLATSGAVRRSGAPLVFVTNEDADNVTIIDSGTDSVIATVPAGKRPRGVRLSPDGKTLFVAVSGSPKGGPGVDESKLPPPFELSRLLFVRNRGSQSHSAVVRFVVESHDDATVRGVAAPREYLCRLLEFQ